MDGKQMTGFTLIELMIVVAILGILSAVAVAAYGIYVKKSRKAEATTVLADIRIKQEAYRGAFHQYADLSSNDCGWVPNGAPGASSHGTWITDPGWPDDCEANWAQLGASLQNNIYYSYWGEARNGGAATSGICTDYKDLADSYAGGGWWYGALAMEDLDGDGVEGGLFIVSGVETIFEIDEGDI